MAALGIIGIIVGVAVLIYGAYKGISTIILAPLYNAAITHPINTGPSIAVT